MKNWQAIQVAVTCANGDILDHDNGTSGMKAQFAPIVGGMPFLTVIASWDEDWDHVSVSTLFRCPTWEEMCRMKTIFFEDTELVVQFHPPSAQFIHHHPYCLHLWLGHKQAIRLPESDRIAPTT